MKENKNELFGIEITNNVEENVEIVKETKEVKANKNLKISDTLTLENDDDTPIKKFIKQFIDEDTQDDNMNLIIKECMNNLSCLDIGKVNEKIIFFITSYIRRSEEKNVGGSFLRNVLGSSYPGGMYTNTGTVNHSSNFIDAISNYMYYITLDKTHNGLLLSVYIGDKEGSGDVFILKEKEKINLLLESLFEMTKNVLKERQKSETLLDDFFGEI